MSIFARVKEEFQNKHPRVDYSIFDIDDAVASSSSSSSSSAVPGVAFPNIINNSNMSKSMGEDDYYQPYALKSYGPRRLKGKRLRSANKFSRLQSFGTHGAARLKRGSEFTLGTFGPTWADATNEQKMARELSGWRGKGLYHGRGFYKGFGGDVGQWIGNKVGLGGLGRALGTAGAKFTGFGDYVGNDAVGGAGVEHTVPSFAPVNDGMGNTVVTYREYMCDIYGPDTAFGIQTFALNPGIEATFPFLSQIACNYEEYEMKQCMFTFKSNIAPIGSSTSGQVGEVIMATNYNAAAPAFRDKSTMLQSALSMSARATESQVHGVECDPTKLSGSVGKYVRNGPVTVDEDLKTYDHGLFQVAVTGIPSEYKNQPIGELWCSYTVHLRKPRKYSALGFAIGRDSFAMTSARAGATIDISGRDLLGVAAGLTMYGQQNSIGCKLAAIDWDGLTTTALVTIPASYAGRLRLAVTGKLPQLDIIGANGLSVGYYVRPGCNIVPFDDFPTSDPQVLSTMKSSLTSTGAYSGEWHFDVQPVGTSGVDNQVSIKMGITDPTLGGFDWIQVVVEEYNTSASKENGNTQWVDGNGTALTVV
ncbi:MAG: coat protein [Circoviridae sp.]|nr:MAG: coat protein [Circoviridae sp.]